MKKILLALCLALFLFFASVAAKAEAPSPSEMVGIAFNLGIEVGCLRAILREQEMYGISFLTGPDCEAILDEYGIKARP